MIQVSHGEFYLVLRTFHTAQRKIAKGTRMLTLAPSLAKMIAVAFPIPDDAPVTSATFPSNLPPMINDVWRLILKMSISV